MAEHAKRVRRPESRPPQTRYRSIVRAVLTIAASAAVAVPALLLPGPAHAQDSPEEIEAQIDEAWRELEPVIEEHNATRQELEEKEKELEKLEEKIEPLQMQVDLAQAEVADIAVHTFKGGNVTTFKALLANGNALSFADQLTLLDQFARAQNDKIADVVETKERYEAEREELDKLVAELSEMEADLAARAEEIDAEIEELQDLRAEAYGTSGATGDLAPEPCPTEYPGGAAGTAVSFACDQIGKPYVWGAAGPDAYDCSGLMLDAWAQAGVSLPHNAASQRSSIPYVDRSELRPGDLVFFYSGLSHVGMYVGNGWMVHAPQPGDVVRMNPIDQMPINSYGRPG